MNMRNWRKWTPSIPCITVNKYTNCRNFPLSLQLLIHSTFPSSFQLICSLPVLFLPYYHVLFPFPHPPLVYFGLFSYLPSNYLCTLPINKKKKFLSNTTPKNEYRYSAAKPPSHSKDLFFTSLIESANLLIFNSTKILILCNFQPQLMITYANFTNEVTEVFDVKS